MVDKFDKSVLDSVVLKNKALQNGKSQKSKGVLPKIKRVSGAFKINRRTKISY